MAVTMFISIWISNAAAISTMVPIIKAVLEELENVSFDSPKLKLLKLMGKNLS